ncbi:MAG: hypothetical protein JSV57_04805 [Candidatus Bathyarchaeota archaeon]|nr:MAG: hypothetical protein JSV57_04805 [Candidatus Bathyarchaeota archaeon]
MKEEKLLNMKTQDEQEHIEIYLKYSGFEEDLKGPVDQVLRGLFSSLNKIHPSLELLSKVQLTVDLQGLIEEMKDIVIIAPNGPLILCEKKLTVKELIGLNLIGAFVGHKLNLLDKISLTLDELAALTGKTKGSVSRRITSMVNDRWVEKPERGEYKISLVGIKHFKEKVFPNLKEEAG